MHVKREKININLLFEKNLQEFLEKFSLYEAFTKGELKCQKCGKTVTIDNLGLLKISKRKVIFVCDNPECMKSDYD
jgi:hypothetical protein